MKYSCTVLVIAVSIASISSGLSQEPLGTLGKTPEVAEVKARSTIAAPLLEEARHQAEILHTAMHSTLQVVHHRYYRKDEGLLLPAAVLKDVFAELEKDQHIQLRWLAVDGQAMNSDHEPQDQFEMDAVQALKSGKRDYERVEGGVYRRVAAIKLTNHCLKCHIPNRKSLEDRTAGLIIAIPIIPK
ncbi:MAG: hypothetical protein JWM11_7901 [Planctomycetaceae bacterium]|nr:hypothetical protein [Planctomycetaceae bacterium]